MSSPNNTTGGSMYSSLYTLFPFFCLVLFATAVGGTYYIIGTRLGGNDNSSDVLNNLKIIFGVNIAIFVVFVGLNIYLLRSRGMYGPIYQSLMIHLAVLMSLMSVSISLLDKTSS